MARLIITCLLLAAGFAGFSQTTQQKLKQVKADPATTTRAAQADVKQVDNKAPVKQATIADLKTLNPQKKRLHRKSTRTSR